MAGRSYFLIFESSGGSSINEQGGLMHSDSMKRHTVNGRWPQPRYRFLVHASVVPDVGGKAVTRVLLIVFSHPTVARDLGND